MGHLLFCFQKNVMPGGRLGRGRGVGAGGIQMSSTLHGSILYPESFSFFGHWVVARTDSGELEFYYGRISAVKQCKLLQGSQSKNLNKIPVPQTFLLATNCWPKTLRTLGTRLISRKTRNEEDPGIGPGRKNNCTAESGKSILGVRGGPMFHKK